MCFEADLSKDWNVASLSPVTYKLYSLALKEFKVFYAVLLEKIDSLVCSLSPYRRNVLSLSLLYRSSNDKYSDELHLFIYLFFTSTRSDIHC